METGVNAQSCQLPNGSQNGVFGLNRDSGLSHDLEKPCMWQALSPLHHAFTVHPGPSPPRATFDKHPPSTPCLLQSAFWLTLKHMCMYIALCPLGPNSTMLQYMSLFVRPCDMYRGLGGGGLGALGAAPWAPLHGFDLRITSPCACHNGELEPNIEKFQMRDNRDVIQSGIQADERVGDRLVKRLEKHTAGPEKQADSRRLRRVGDGATYQTTSVGQTSMYAPKRVAMSKLLHDRKLRNKGVSTTKKTNAKAKIEAQATWYLFGVHFA